MNKKIETEEQSASNVMMVFHQLKRPLYTLREIFLLIDSEEIGPLNKDQKEYIKGSMNEINTTIEIMGTLLEAVKIEAKEYRVSKESVDLVSITEAVINQMLALMKASRISVIFEKEKEKFLAVTDEIKIKFVVETLMSNAIKYKSPGKEGKIKVWIKEVGDEILFSIEDNGIGLSDEERVNVFNKFYRTEEAINISPEGQGLGLFISKAIIELSGGSMWVEKNEEEGVIFYFKLLKA